MLRTQRDAELPGQLLGDTTGYAATFDNFIRIGNFEDAGSGNCLKPCLLYTSDAADDTP